MIYDICRCFIRSNSCTIPIFSFAFKMTKIFKSKYFEKVKKAFKHEIKLFLNIVDQK